MHVSFLQDTARLEYLIPKRTSLRHRLPMGDQGFIDFVSHLLEINPKKRPSASEALKHPWLSYPYEPISSWTIIFMLFLHPAKGCPRARIWAWFETSGRAPLVFIGDIYISNAPSPIIYRVVFQPFFFLNLFFTITEKCNLLTDTVFVVHDVW